MKKFRMRPKLQPPKPEMEKRTISLYDGDTTLRSVLDRLDADGIDYEKVKFVSRPEYYGEYSNEFEYEVPESPEHFLLRQNYYEKKLKEYEAWYQKNVDAISKYEADQKAEKKAKAEAELVREKANLQRKLQQIEKELQATSRRIKKLDSPE